MTDYMGLAAAELDRVRRLNSEMHTRAMAARVHAGGDEGAEELEATVTETSFRLAEDYIALAALERDVPSRSHADADEFAAAERRREAT